MANAPQLVTGLDEPLDAEEQSALEAEQQAPPEEQTEQQQPPPDEAAQQAQAEKPQEKGKEKKLPEHVPYQRFQEVNQERAQAMREANELRERWARLEERARLAQEAETRIQQAAQASKGPQRPDETVDPVGAQLWDRDQQIAQLRQQVEQVQQGVGLTQQQVQQQAEQQQFQTWLQQDVAAVERTTPHYSQAAQYVFENVRNFAKELGANDQQAEQFLGALQVMATRTAMQAGKSPAAAFYNLANNLGFTPQQQQAAQQAQQQPNAAQVAQIKLEQAKAGQKHQGLTRAPAENEDNILHSNLGPTELANMPEAQFMAMLEDPKQRKILERAFGKAEGVEDIVRLGMR